jgi:hypothetical protein
MSSKKSLKAAGMAGRTENPPRSNSGNAGGEAGCGNAGGGDGGNDPNYSDSKPEEMDEDEDKDPKEDPVTGQQGKEYRPKMESGKVMAKMFVRFCQLSRANARAIVVYYGVSSPSRKVDFLESHWKDTFTQWQKRHPYPNRMERAMVLSPPQQDRIQCAA